MTKEQPVIAVFRGHSSLVEIMMVYVQKKMWKKFKIWWQKWISLPKEREI